MNHWFPMVSLKRRPFWSLISERTLGKCPTHGGWMRAKMLFCDPNNLRLGKTSPSGGGQNAFHLGFGIYRVLCPNDRFPISWFLPGCDSRWKKLIDIRFTNPPHLSFCLDVCFFNYLFRSKGDNNTLLWIILFKSWHHYNSSFDDCMRSVMCRKICISHGQRHPFMKDQMSASVGLPWKCLLHEAILWISVF